MNKRELKGVLTQPIAFHRIFAQVGGSVNAALFLSQAHYWSDKTSDPDGWFYKSRDEWKRETALTRSEQETARKHLKKRGILEEDTKGMPARLYYRVNYDVLCALIEAFLNRLDNPAPEDDDGEPADMVAEILPTRRQESCQQGGAKAANMVAQKQPALIGTETTSESTQTNGHSNKNSKANGKKTGSPEDAAFAAFDKLPPRDQTYAREQARMQGRPLHEVMWDLFNSECAREQRALKSGK